MGVAYFVSVLLFVSTSYSVLTGYTVGVSIQQSHASGLAWICMVDNGLAGPCTDDMGIAYFISARWSIGGGAWLVCVALCCGCLKVLGLTFYYLLKNMGQIHRL